MLITTDVKEAEEAELSVLLVKDNWDDYSYKTTFYAFLYLKGEKVDLGMVKIMTTELDDKSSLSHRGENTSTKIPENIDSLPDGFVSLGQELDYYRKISALGRRNGDKVLHALKDCAVYYRPNESVTEHKAFWDSLMRGSEAKKCFNEGANYYFGTVEKKKLSFDYKCDLFENSGSSINFEFNADSDLPSTTNIVIGKNGSGKTRLLGKLAKDIIAGGRQNVFYPERPPISRVVAISYSVFDNFWVPEGEELENYKDYKYLGLKKYNKKAERYEVKTQEDYWWDVETSLGQILSKSHVDQELVDVVLDFVTISNLDEIGDIENLDELEVVFNKMSSGQKISFSIICQMAAFLEDDSIVLFDEPENHLHPGLLWSMMVTFDKVLKKKRSYAVIATHSPLILQQIPSDFVNMVSREGGAFFSRKLDVECFGDNLQSIMEKVFGFIEPEHDYRDVFKFLIREKGYEKEKIESLFSKELSLQARVFLTNSYKNLK